MMQAGGFTNQEDFLRAFPTEESFMNQYPQFREGGNLQQVGFANPFRKFSGGGPFEGKPKFIIPSDLYPTPKLDENVGNMLDARIQAGIIPQVVASTPKEEYVNKNYNGVSIVDYLSSLKNGTGNSMSDRKTLAEQNGIKDYRGTAQQNTELLNLLRGTTTSTAPSAGTSVSKTVRGTTPKKVTNSDGISAADAADYAARRKALDVAMQTANNLPDAMGFKKLLPFPFNLAVLGSRENIRRNMSNDPIRNIPFTNNEYNEYYHKAVDYLRGIDKSASKLYPKTQQEKKAMDDAMRAISRESMNKYK